MKLDMIAVVMVALAVMISIYLSTFNMGLESVFPAILLVSGLALTRLFYKTEVGDVKGGNIAFYTVIGITSTYMIALVVPEIFRLQSIEPSLQASLLAVLMAVAEEVFFRGFMMGFFEKMSNSFWASNILQAIVWASYHTAVYGNMPSIMAWILLTGIIYGWIDKQCNSLTPSILAHALVNFMATGGLP